MLWQIVVLLIGLWMIYTRYQNRKLIQLSKCLKNDYKPLPFIGHAYLFIGNGEVLMRTMQLQGRQALKHGGMTGIWLGGNYYVMIADPAVLELVMKASLEKDNVMRFLRHLTGNGTVFAPLPIWRPRRKILAPTFSSKNLKQFMKIFIHQSSVMVNQLQEKAGTGPFSIWKYLTTYTMDSVCETTLGVKLNAQLQTNQPFLKAFERLCQLASQRIFQPWLYYDSVYCLMPSYMETEKNKKIVLSFINEIIVSKRKEIQRNKNSNNTTKENNEKDGRLKTFLELLIECSGGDRGYSDIELLEETMVLVLAGTDTSAVGTSFTTVMLSKYPNVQQKVYQELQDVFADTDQPIQVEGLHHLKYLDAVVRETLRLYPPVPIVVRKMENDLKLASGVTLVKGCGIMVNIWGTHRNPEYWGNDADLFRPERFMNSPPLHPAAFQAFSYGPRSCIGYQYAMMSIKAAVASLLSKYRILPDVNTETASDAPLRVTFEIMMKDANRFTVQLEKRSR